MWFRLAFAIFLTVLSTSCASAQEPGLNEREDDPVKNEPPLDEGEGGFYGYEVTPPPRHEDYGYFVFSYGPYLVKAPLSFIKEYG